MLMLFSFRQSVMFLLGSGYGIEQSLFQWLSRYEAGFSLCEGCLFSVKHYLFEAIFENPNKTYVMIIRLSLWLVLTQHLSSWPVRLVGITAHFLLPTIAWSASQCVGHCLWVSTCSRRKIALNTGVILPRFPSP